MGVYRELQCRSLTSGLNKLHCKKHLRSLQSQLEIKWNLLNPTMPPDYHQAKRPEEEEASAAVPRLLPSHKVGKKPLLEIRGVRGHSTQWLISSMLQSPNRIQDFKKADAVAAHLWKLLRGWYYLKMYMCAQSLQVCPTPCDPMDCSPSGSFVRGILQVRILEWVAMLSSRGSSRLRTELEFPLSPAS